MVELLSTGGLALIPGTQKRFRVVQAKQGKLGGAASFLVVNTRGRTWLLCSLHGFSLEFPVHFLKHKSSQAQQHYGCVGARQGLGLSEWSRSWPGDWGPEPCAGPSQAQGPMVQRAL